MTGRRRDTLERLARGGGLEASVSFHPPMTREERRSLALHRAIAERLAQDPGAVLGQARRTLERMRTVASRDSQPIREWSVLLDRPPSALIPLLTDRRRGPASCGTSRPSRECSPPGSGRR